MPNALEGQQSQQLAGSGSHTLERSEVGQMGGDVLDPKVLALDFPLLSRQVNGLPIVYLDSANSAQKPSLVIDAMNGFLRNDYAPINRSAYYLAGAATEAFEASRVKVAKFINAPSSEEVVFTKNATESINLVARTWGHANIGSGDKIVLSQLEHHANIVPWQMLAQEKGATISWIPIDVQGQFDLTSFAELVVGAKIVAISAMSNVLGTITPVRQVADLAHAAGALVLVDGCQSVPHSPTDVVAMGADFFAFSSHKMCGPTGLGVLWGRRELLEAMPPFLGGGSMITNVTFDGFTTAPIPYKFEAGTQAITEVIGLGAAVDYLSGLGMDKIRNHEIAMTNYVMDALNSRFGDDIKIHGPSDCVSRGATFSFAFRDVHPHDVSQILDERNVYVRSGHHCAKPLMKLLGVGATVRASFYLYNSTTDVDALCDALGDVSKIF